LKFTHSLGVKYRLNTNSWWANEKDFSIGKQHFASAKHFVDYLKSLNIWIFAFSCDSRLDSTRNLKNLISSIKLCEDADITYQLIFTGMKINEIAESVLLLNHFCGKLKNMIPPAVMEMVDIGGATEIDNTIFCGQSNSSYCNKKGFYRPTTLHVAPDGKVRTCMYAIGLDDCGNLREMTMLDIVKNFPHRANNDLFSDPIKYEKAKNELLLPYLRHYHPITHECTQFAIIARAAEMAAKHPEMNLNEIHSIIASSVNATRTGDKMEITPDV
jgi:hypothetical protein